MDCSNNSVILLLNLLNNYITTFIIHTYISNIMLYIIIFIHWLNIPLCLSAVVH